MIKSKIILISMMIITSNSFAACKSKKAVTKEESKVKIQKTENDTTKVIAKKVDEKPEECKKPWGNSPEEINTHQKNYTLFKLELKDKKYLSAYNYWQLVISKVPCATENLYYYAPELLDSVRSRTADEKRKSIILDSLLDTYPNRIKYFGKKGLIKLEWAYALQNHKPKETNKIYNLYKESEAILGHKMDYYATSNYFLLCIKKYKKKELKQEEIIDIYLDLSENSDKNISKKNNVEEWNGAQTYMDQLVARSKILNCDKISSIFKPKLEANPNDMALKLKVIKLFRSGKCSSNSLYIGTLKDAHASNPTTNTAKELATYYSSVKQNGLANKYWSEVVAGTDDINEKANIYLRLASSGSCANKNLYLNKALAINPNNGKALINKIIVLSRCSGCSGFDARAANWVYVDMLNAAKAKDPSISAKANSLIAQYKKGYPTKKEWFQKNLQPNQRYTVACLGRSTTVR